MINNPLKLLIVCTFLFFTLPILAFSNEPDGFRGIEWFKKFSKVKNEFTFLKTDQADYFYSRKNDKLQIGSANLTSIIYVFNRRGFKSVIISSHGETNNSNLIHAFNQRYGAGGKPNQYMERYIWSGTNSTIILDCNEVNAECNAILSSRIMLDLEKLDLKQKHKNLDSDF